MYKKKKLFHHRANDNSTKRGDNKIIYMNLYEYNVLIEYLVTK